ncbi:MAG: hypothetical protein QHH75_13915 [Bacillota bacterium]|nr:hypothetical protein [Bacillota bacterium]
MKQVKILSLLLIMLIMGTIVAACGKSGSTRAKEEVTRRATEEITKIVGDDTREKRVSAKEAVNLVLAEARKWQADAEVVEIRNEFGIFGNGKGTTWLIYVISRSAPPTTSGYGKDYYVGRRYVVEDGKAKLNFDDSMYKVSSQPFPKDFIDSTEALKIAQANGTPKDDKYALYLGRKDDTEKYGKVVMNFHTLVNENSKLVKKGVILDPVSKEVIEVLK